jgi:carboxyl-terminal processing protease
MPTDYRCAPSARRRVMNLPLALVLSGLALLGMQACGGRGKAVAEAAPVREDVRLLTDEQRAKHLESFDIAWQTIRDGHFDANLNGVDWEAAKAELRPRVEAAKTADDARGAINDLVAKLKQTHFGLIPSDAYERITPKAEAEASVVADASASTGTASGPGVLGVRVRVVNDRALVTRVVEDTPAYSAGVRPGWIIDAINTDPVAPSLKASEHTSGSPALGAAMAARAIESRLDGSLSNTVRVTFTDGNDRSVTHTLQRVAPRGTPARVANLPTMYVEYESKRLPENVGYVWLSIFLDPTKVSPFFDEAISGFAGTDGMVLDLRGNPGGLGVMAIGIGGYFVEERNQKLGTMRTRQMPLNFVLNPRAEPYVKPLAILVDECSLSTSEILAGGLQDLKRARVFGTRTGGAALPSVIKKLPSGDALQYAMADYVSASGRSLEGNGVIPDEEVGPTREALLSGVDPTLQAAIRWIRTQSQR